MLVTTLNLFFSKYYLYVIKNFKYKDRVTEQILTSILTFDYIFSHLMFIKLFGN